MKAPRLISRLLPAAGAAALVVAATAVAQTAGTVPPLSQPQPPNGTESVPPPGPQTRGGPTDSPPKNGVVAPPPTGDQEIQKPTPSTGPNSMPVIKPPSSTVPK